MMLVDLSKLDTEQINPNTRHLDTLDSHSMVKLMHQEDHSVYDAIGKVVDEISQAVDLIVNTIKNNGRLVYIGAGTSGRLGVLDASECLPTFGVGEEAVIGIIAGGDKALRIPIEGAEDDTTLAEKDLKKIGFNENDILCAVTSSGRTPYCIGGLRYARSLQAKTIALSCVANSESSAFADIAIEAVVGPEVVTGSTRLKAGTATKMILNMLTTLSMVQLGKVYGNLMVDVKTSNKKLESRAIKIIMSATDCTKDTAQKALLESGNDVKSSIAMVLNGWSKEQALNHLKQVNGKLSAL